MQNYISSDAKPVKAGVGINVAERDRRSQWLEHARKQRLQNSHTHMHTASNHFLTDKKTNKTKHEIG